MVVEHLIATGRCNIAYLGLEEEDQADHDKLRGYRQTLAQAGISFDPKRVHRGPRTFQGGYEAMASFVAQQIQVDGIFASMTSWRSGQCASLRHTASRFPATSPWWGLAGQRSQA